MSGGSQSSKVSGAVSPRRARAQLAKILRSEEFRVTDRGRRILAFLVEESLAGRSNQIKGSTIAREVLGRGDDFKAASDPIVSIEVRKVREALEHYYLTSGQSDAVGVELPLRSYVPRFFPREVGVTMGGMIRDKTSRWSPVIEVEPISGGGGEGLSDQAGIILTEELVMELSAFRELSVVSRAGGRRAGSKRVHGVISGVIRPVSDGVSLSLRLVNSVTGISVWAERFDFPKGADGGLLDSDGEVARMIAGRVGGDHGAVNRYLVPAVWSGPARERPVGYQAMMAYYHFDRHRTGASLEEATTMLQKACAEDPSNGLLKTMYANTLTFRFGLALSDDPQLLDEALDLARAAVRLEPENQFCLETVGLILFHMGQPDAALEMLGQAYRLNPNSAYRVALIAWDMMLCGEWERGAEMLTGAMERNPGNPSWLWFAFCWNHYRSGNYASALSEANRPDLPDLFWIPLMRAACLAKLERSEEAKARVKRVLSMHPDFEVRGRSMLARFIKEKALFDDLVEGLRLAGLEIQ